MNNVLISALLLVSATHALAQTDIHPLSAAIGDRGLATVEADLSRLENPDANEKFILGGVRFLRGVERSFQTRYRYGITAEHSVLPLLRMGILPNPDPESFKPAMIAGIFEDALQDMEQARTALEDIEEAADVGAVIALNDLWFDLNENGIREARIEDLAAFFPRNAEATGIVRFDQADVAWLRAYTHVISGMGELVLAFDPTEAIGTVAKARAQLDRLTVSDDQSRWFHRDQSIFDYLATVNLALSQQPDRGRVHAAHSHLLQMVAENRIFWQRADAETDNQAEWIPSDTQTSALGMVFPEGTGTTWLSVLTDMDKVLTGELLVPHALFGKGGGINIASWVDDPQPIDVLGWLHGYGVIDHVEQGPRLDDRNWRRFNQLVQRRNGMFYAVVLN